MARLRRGSAAGFGSSGIGRRVARTAVVASVGLSLGVPLTAVPSVAATARRAAAVPGELVLPPAARAVPRATQILNAGTTGFLWAQESDDRLL